MVGKSASVKAELVARYTRILYHVDGALTVSDPDSGGNLAGASVQIGSGFANGDVLHFTNTTHITGSFNGSGLLTLTGTDTVADYQTALDSITFSSTGNATGVRTIDWSVTDGSTSNGTSPTATSTVDSVFVPQINAGTPTPTFNGGDPAVMLDSRLQLSDGGSTTLAGATVTITSGGVSGDVLSFNNGTDTETFGDGGKITASYVAGVLSLTGTASLADYQTALHQVQFSFSPANGDPTGGRPIPPAAASAGWSATARNRVTQRPRRSRSRTWRRPSPPAAP